MPRLPRHEHDLSAMMALVRDQICEDVHDIDRQVQPCDAGRRELAAVPLDDALSPDGPEWYGVPRHRVR